MRHPTVLVFALLPLAPLTAQQSGALFDAPVVAIDAWSRIDCLVDIDLDGDLDGVGVWTKLRPRDEADFEAHLNDGNGNLSSGSFVIDVWNIFNDTPNALHVAVGDWNGDGHDDVAVVGPGLLKAYRVHNAGGPPVEWDRVTGLFDPNQLVAADVDGDGDDDLAVVDDDKVLFYRAEGGQFEFVVSWHAQTEAVFATESEGDNDAEFALIRGNEIQFLGFDGSRMAETGRVTIGAIQDPMPVSGDVDNDGDIDIVVFGTTHYTTLRRTGPATFAVESPTEGGPATGLADIDGDGDLDGVCCGGGGPTNSAANTALAKFHLSPNDGTGSFAKAWTIPNVGARHLAGAADIDGDGDIDLVAGRGVYYNQDSFTRQPQPEMRNLMGDRFPSIADIDMDGDPDFDVYAGNHEQNRGDGNTRNMPQVMPQAPAGYGFGGAGYRGDFDGDEDVDYVVAMFAGTTFHSMRLLRNEGGGSFADGGPAAAVGEVFNPALAVPVHGEPTQLVADLDGDGDVDVASNYWFPRLSACQVWLNDGTGFFVRGGRMLLENAFHAADFDGDDIIDLFVVRPPDTHGSSSGSFYFRKGVGDGTFPSTFGFIDRTSWLSTRFGIADVDGDGDVDLASDDSARPILYRNDGTGVFTPEHPLGQLRMDWTSTAYRAAFLVDLDGDGRRDWVSYPAKYGSFHTARVALQNPLGGFDLVAEQVIKPAQLIDADGDGDLDVVGDRLVRSTRFHGAAAGRRVQFGESTRGAGSVAPILGADGPFRTGEAVTSRITGAVGGTSGVYFVGLQQARLMEFPLPGLTTYTWPPIAAAPIYLSGSAGVPGVGSLTLPYVVPATFGGKTLYVQVFLLDAANPFGVVQTGGLQLRYGN